MHGGASDTCPECAGYFRDLRVLGSSGLQDRPGDLGRMLRAEAASASWPTFHGGQSVQYVVRPGDYGPGVTEWAQTTLWPDHPSEGGRLYRALRDAFDQNYHVVLERTGDEGTTIKVFTDAAPSAVDAALTGSRALGPLPLASEGAWSPGAL